ncbi:MAG: RDD family protein [Maribacter sp.]
MTKIDKGIRFTNFSTDYFIIFFIWLMLAVGSGGELFEISFFYVILFLYYFAFELSNGQTLGKKITNTKIVGRNGKPASGIRIFARSLLRLVPFDIVSYLFETETGLHDLLSGTKLKKITF